MRKNLVVVVIFIFLFAMSIVSAQEINDNHTICEVSNLNEDYVQVNDDLNFLEENSEEITVNDWEDLQYYCSLQDKDYTLKLKENTNYYPNDVTDMNYQIQVKNNVTIIGSNGSYIGDKSSNAGKITYNAIFTEDDSKIGIKLENVTFKWIATEYQSDGVFLTMGGNTFNSIKNCYFYNITTNVGHSSIVYLKRGDATLENCTFINCTTDFGCVSIYDPRDNPYGVCNRARMMMYNCYFENNFAKVEPGCINNCGILMVYNSTFVKNRSFWWAGAIHTHCGANTTIFNSNFTDNVAGWNGGALFTYSWLQIYNSTFRGNNCTTNNGGGAIGACFNIHSPFVHIDNCLFENNENTCWEIGGESTTGTGRGGAISIFDDGLLEVFNSTFIKNSASIGSAICAHEINFSQRNLPLDVRIIGNKFINHSRVGDVLIINVSSNAICEIQNNYYENNSIEFLKLNLSYTQCENKFLFNIEPILRNPSYYDSDILDNCEYEIYVNGSYLKKINCTSFSLVDVESSKVYLIPSISNIKSNTVEVIVKKNSSISVNVTDIEYGQNQTIEFIVSPKYATGILNVVVNNKLYTVKIDNPFLNLGILSAGKYNVSVSYEGDLRCFSSYNASSFVVIRKNLGGYNVDNTSGISVMLPNDATGVLIVTINGKNYTQNLVNGCVSIEISDLAVGCYDAVVTYSGDENYLGFTQNTTVTVKEPAKPATPTDNQQSTFTKKTTKKASKIVAKKKTFKRSKKVKKYTITLKSGKKAIKKVKVYLKVKGKTYKATTNSKGKATFKIKKLTKKGKYTAVIKFKGNKTYKATTKKVKITIKK